MSLRPSQEDYAILGGCFGHGASVERDGISGQHCESADAIAEQMDVDPATGRGSLGVLDSSPNNVAAIGENRESYMFSINGRDLSTLQLLPNKILVSPDEMRLRECFSTLATNRCGR